MAIKRELATTPYFVELKGMLQPVCAGLARLQSLILMNGNAKPGQTVFMGVARVENSRRNLTRYINALAQGYFIAGDVAMASLELTPSAIRMQLGDIFTSDARLDALLKITDIAISGTNETALAQLIYKSWLEACVKLGLPHTDHSTSARSVRLPSQVFEVPRPYVHYVYKRTHPAADAVFYTKRLDGNCPLADQPAWLTELTQGHNTILHNLELGGDRKYSGHLLAAIRREAARIGLHINVGVSTRRDDPNSVGDAETYALACGGETRPYHSDLCLGGVTMALDPIVYFSCNSLAISWREVPITRSAAGSANGVFALTARSIVPGLNYTAGYSNTIQRASVDQEMDDAQHEPWFRHCANYTTRANLFHRALKKKEVDFIYRNRRVGISNIGLTSSIADNIRDPQNHPLDETTMRNVGRFRWLAPTLPPLAIGTANPQAADDILVDSTMGVKRGHPQCLVSYPDISLGIDGTAGNPSILIMCKPQLVKGRKEGVRDPHVRYAGLRTGIGTKTRIAAQIDVSGSLTL
jgi:hypothetical protein